jgi:hypothetical protein
MSDRPLASRVNTEINAFVEAAGEIDEPAWFVGSILTVGRQGRAFRSRC